MHRVWIGLKHESMTSVSFRLIEEPNYWHASVKRSSVTWRSSCVSSTRVQSSANRSSPTNSRKILVFECNYRRLKSLPLVQKRMWTPVSRLLNLDKTLFRHREFPSSISPAIIPRRHTKHICHYKTCIPCLIKLAKTPQNTSLLTVLIFLLNQQCNNNGPCYVHNPFLYSFLFAVGW